MPLLFHIACSHLWSPMRQFKSVTKEVWLHMRCHFLHLYTCAQSSKQWNIITTQDCWIRNTVGVHGDRENILLSIINSVFKQMPSQWFFSQYCIHLLRKPVRPENSLLSTNELEEQSSVYFRYWSFFLTLQGQSLDKSVTIESSLESGCGLSHESAQDGCNGTYVKIEAS